MDAEADRAAIYLEQGKVILYPTDTIWGLGCDATNEEAVDQIYRIKKRSDSKSMLVLVADLEMLKACVQSVPEKALEIIENASRPTSIIYPGARNLAENLLAEDGSVGIRLTSDPFCRALIRRTGRPLVSTSANISGEPAPSIYPEIPDAIRSKADYIVGWRHEEKNPAQPSSIVRIEPGGDLTVIR